MFKNKIEIIKDKTGVEGGFVDNPDDKGGPTIYGITQTTAGEWRSLWAKYNWDGNMRTMPKDLAYEIYDKGWWQKLYLDQVFAHSAPLAERMFDFAINAGRGNCGRCFQMILNVLNKQQSLWPDLVIDGNVGPGTMKAFDAFMRTNAKDAHAVHKLTMMLFSAQNWHYVLISLDRERNETFTNGWMNRTYRDFYNFAEWLTPN